MDLSLIMPFKYAILKKIQMQTFDLYGDLNRSMSKVIKYMIIDMNLEYENTPCLCF